MGRSQALLVHQVHLGKLAVDVGSAALSTVLLWRGHRRTGMAVRYLGPPIGSALVMSRADLGRLAGTRRGRYASAYLSPTAQAVRLAGDTVMAWGASRRSWPVLGTGLVLVALGWSQGLVGPPRVATEGGREPVYRPVPPRSSW